MLKAHKFLIVIAILLLLISFSLPQSEFTINVSWRTFSIGSGICFKFLAIFLFLLAIFYKYLNQYLKIKLLTWIHILLSILLPLAAFWYNYDFHKSLALIETTNNGSVDYILKHSSFINRILLVLILIQILPILNLSFGLVFKRKLKLKK